MWKTSKLSCAPFAWSWARPIGFFWIGWGRDSKMGWEYMEDMWYLYIHKIFIQYVYIYVFVSSFMEHTMSTYIYIYYWNTIAFNVYSLYHSLFPECVKGSHSYEIMLHIHKKLSFLLGVAGWPSGAWTVLTCSNVYPVGPRREKTRRLWTKRCLALVNPPEGLGKIGWGYLGWSNIFYPIVYRAIVLDVLVNIPLFINILGDIW